ncbi:MAG: hypothetical protein F9K47_11885 [Burkholderiales bacterium]|nr:MAG: hypothetical protein F9K47_11885 [Burkholderiales bacterium]
MRETILHASIPVSGDGSRSLECLCGEYEDRELASARLRLHTDHDWVDVGDGVVERGVGCCITLVRPAQA